MSKKRLSIQEQVLKDIEAEENAYLRGEPEHGSEITIVAIIILVLLISAVIF